MRTNVECFSILMNARKKRIILNYVNRIVDITWSEVVELGTVTRGTPNGGKDLGMAEVLGKKCHRTKVASSITRVV